ncbi:MAG: aminopeptidase [Pseudomonadota bacterium]
MFRLPSPFSFAPRRAPSRPLWPLAAALLLSGCASSTTVGYYWQSVSGHAELMRAARPVDDWLADASTSDALKQRLRLAQRIRSFASRQLGLPDNASYHRFADLGRSAAVWNVVAAPPLSLKLQTWCFPVTGCVGYRGYYKQADAREEAAALHGQGLETAVYGVPAYSTLGWFDWAGGDPLLSTFIRYPEGELARMVFHELAHQVVYAPGDTMFNESFATTVERIGRDRWLATEASGQARAEYARFSGRTADFRTLTGETRERLQQIYARKDQAVDTTTLLAQKTQALQDFRSRYAVLRERWGGDAAQLAGYDAWVAGANNASFGTLAAYDGLVPGFQALFARVSSAPGDPWPRFYAEVRRLADMPQNQRHAVLKELADEPTPATPLTATAPAA